MKLKVCGMRDSHNIEQVLALEPDYMGFIFYDKSPRNVGEQLDAEFIKKLSAQTKKVGVFVNEELDRVFMLVRDYDLDYVQLHGDESPEYVAELFALGIRTIKAFGIDEDFDFDRLSNYHPFTDFFLFDTKSKQRGGTGVKFDWELLKSYDQKIPFFLSGGVDLEDIYTVKGLEGLRIHAIDVNSRFELEPGLKDVKRLAELKEVL